MTTNKKPSFVERIKQLYHFLTSGIWTITEKELTKSTRFSVRLLKKLILSARGVTEDNLFIKASALSYYTLLALVPILALVIAIGRGFGFQAAVVDWLTHALSAQAEMIPYIIEFVENYLQRAQGGVFLGVGFAILIWSVLSAFRQIENNFNDIWDVKKSRSIVRQFTMYISLMLLIPILIALSSGFSIFINTQLANSGLSDFFSPLTRFFLKIAPYFIYSLLFYNHVFDYSEYKSTIQTCTIGWCGFGSRFSTFSMAVCEWTNKLIQLQCCVRKFCGNSSVIDVFTNLLAHCSIWC